MTDELQALADRQRRALLWAGQIEARRLYGCAAVIRICLELDNLAARYKRGDHLADISATKAL